MAFRRLRVPVTVTQTHADLRERGKELSQSISTKVVEAVAEANGIEPTELTVPLYEVVDPDALNHLFQTDQFGGRQSVGRVTFTMAGCDVQVDSRGHVVVTPHETEAGLSGR